MKKILLIALAGFIFASSICAAEKPDIYARPALYIGGTLVKNNEFNKNSVMALPDKTVEVSKSAAVMQKDGFYFFATSYAMYIKVEKTQLPFLTFYNKLSYGGSQDSIFQVKPKLDDKNIVGYLNGAWTIIMRHNIGLKEGTNNITLTLDSNNVISESNEGNNVYNFKITLKP